MHDILCMHDAIFTNEGNTRKYVSLLQPEKYFCISNWSIQAVTSNTNNDIILQRIGYKHW